eukprot:300070-Pyramimonas_sp.AAC.1
MTWCREAVVCSLVPSALSSVEARQSIHHMSLPTQELNHDVVDAVGGTVTAALLIKASRGFA